MPAPSERIDPITSLARRHPRVAAVVTALLGLGLLLLYVDQVREFSFRNDDAFISFRYARHLAEGEGLVWNPGERVEGYTTFLWVLLVAAAIRAGAAAEPFANVLSSLSGGVLLLALAAFGARRSGWRNPWILAAPALLTCFHSFTGWAGNGMETVFFSMLLWSSWARFLVERERPGARRWSPWLFTAAALTRPDGLLFAGLAGGVLALDVLRGRATGRALLTWVAPLVLVVGAHFLWRRAYYGFWLPNTFYAKVNSLRFEDGLRYFGEFHRVYAIGWFLPLWILPAFDRDRREALWLLLPLGAYGAYLLAIGAGIFEFRFVVYLLPFAVALHAEGLRALAAFRPRPVLLTLGLVILALAIGATWRGRDDERAGRTLEVAGVRGFRQLEAVATANLETGRELRALVDAGTLPDDLVICLSAVGALPYVTGLETIDYHGLNDVRIARTPVSGGRVAHEHVAPVEYLVERNVDLHIADRSLFRKYPKAVFPAKQKSFQPYWRHVPIGDRYLSFASYVSEERFREAFGRLRGSDAEGGMPEAAGDGSADGGAAGGNAPPEAAGRDDDR